jgi:hypothetical protein
MSTAFTSLSANANSAMWCNFEFNSNVPNVRALRVEKQVRANLEIDGEIDFGLGRCWTKGIMTAVVDGGFAHWYSVEKSGHVFDRVVCSSTMLWVCMGKSSPFHWNDRHKVPIA